MLSLSPQVDGLPGVVRSVERLATRMKDFTPLWERIGADWLRAQADHWRTGGYGTWAPLSPAYEARKAKTHPGRGLMELSLDLKESMTRKGARGQVWRTSKDQATFGTSIPYAAAHHYGVPSRRLPSREIIDLNPNTDLRWKALTDEWLSGLVTESGL